MKFSVGEICECKSSFYFSGWKECEIIAICDPLKLRNPSQVAPDYTIEVKSFPNKGTPSGLWLTMAYHLRKKRPPQQDNQVAEEWFIDDFNRIFKEKEKA